MKQYQCAIIGAEQGMLTLAVTEQLALPTLVVMSGIIARPLFPVIVDASRMRSLIRRIENAERLQQKRRKASLFLYLRQSQILSVLLTYQFGD